MNKDTQPFPDNLVRAVAQRRVASPQELFVDIYNTARAEFAPSLPLIASERYLPNGFAQAVQAELKRMTTPPPPPPPKPEPTLEELLGRIAAKQAGFVNGQELLAGLNAIREHVRNLDGWKDATQHWIRTHQTNDLACVQLRDKLITRVHDLEVRPAPTVQIEQVEARLKEQFSQLRAELEESVMDLLASGPPPATVDLEQPEVQSKGKFKIAILDPIIRKFAARIAMESPGNVKLYFENLDALPPSQLGGRHFVIYTRRARKVWVDAFRMKLPPERMIERERLGTTNLRKVIEELSQQPYFEL